MDCYLESCLWDFFRHWIIRIITKICFHLFIRLRDPQWHCSDLTQCQLCPRGFNNPNRSVPACGPPMQHRLCIPVCGSNHIWRNILIIMWFPGRVKWIVKGLPMIPLTPLLLPLHPGPCVQLQSTSWKLHKLQNAPEDLKNFWYTSKHPCKAHHCTLYSYILFCEGVIYP